MNKQQHSHIYYILHYYGNNFFQLFQLFLLSAFSAFYFFQLCNTPGYVKQNIHNCVLCTLKNNSTRKEISFRFFFWTGIPRNSKINRAQIEKKLNIKFKVKKVVCVFPDS